MLRPKTSKEELQSQLKDMMEDKDYIYTDQDVLSTIRFIKYEVCNGNNSEFKDFMYPILNGRTIAQSRFTRIGRTMILVEGYKKPQKRV